MLDEPWVKFPIQYFHQCFRQQRLAQSFSGSDCSGDKCVESCEEGWEENGDHCYFWSNDTKSWTDAEDFCQKEGGHLASVASTATHQYVVDGVKSRDLDDAWLGGNDLEEEAAWKWTDCAAWEVEFWITKWGQPNGGTNANCLAFQWERNSDTVGWNDYICHQNQAPFVCSKRICTGKHYQRHALL